MLPALLHGTAFLISLFVQFWGSPLAGSWLFFYLAGCVVLLYQGGYPEKHTAGWYACLAWLITVGASTFLIAPVVNGAVQMWTLGAMPMLALCLRRENLKHYYGVFLAVITLYACGILVQMWLHTETTAFNYEGRHSWPLLDPNNGAAVLNLALIPCFYVTLRRANWSALCGFLCLILAAALIGTGSKAGLAAATIGCGLLVIHRFHQSLIFWCAVLTLGSEAALFLFLNPHLFEVMADSFMDRIPIWSASWPLAQIRPAFGLGLGSFGYYYARVRQEGYTLGWHCHNDMLQFAIEMGLPGAGGVHMAGYLNRRLLYPQYTRRRHHAGDLADVDGRIPVLHSGDQHPDGAGAWFAPQRNPKTPKGQNMNKLFALIIFLLVPIAAFAQATVYQFPDMRVQTTASIASGLSSTGAIDLGGTELVGLQMPASFSGSTVSFQAAVSSGGTMQTMVDGAGSTVTKTVAAGKYVGIDPPCSGVCATSISSAFLLKPLAAA
jgi:O-antigen ligase